MKRGCLQSLLFVAVLFVVFAGSTYFWFNFFIRGKSLPTPDLVGRSVADARAVCSDLGVTLNVDPATRRNSDKVPAGFVAWQNRPAGATNLIKRGTAIRVELSAGALVIRVPALDGQTAGTAMLRLGQQNLRLDKLAYADLNLSGIVAADPPEGTVVAAQAPVSLLIAVPPQPREYVMPDLIDQSIETVRPRLEGRGLKIATVKYEAYPGLADGVVIRQFPLRGSPVSGRDAISVVVSRQEETGASDPPGARGGGALPDAPQQ